MRKYERIRSADRQGFRLSKMRGGDMSRHRQRVRRCVCPECGKSFTTKQWNRKFCGHKCAAKFGKKNASEPGARKSKFVVLYRDSFRCFYCGKSSFRDLVELETDHVRPASRGGDHTISNIVACCFDCNMGKMARVLSNEAELLEEVRARNERIGIPHDTVIVGAKNGRE